MGDKVKAKPVAGVCAVCKVTAKPSHFHTESHLNKARLAAERENRDDPRLFVIE